jgi:hypothetical protein
VSYPTDCEQFWFDRHDAGRERLPVILVGHGDPYRLGAALKELRQRPGQLPGITAPDRAAYASGELQIELDWYPQLPSREPLAIVRRRGERRASCRHAAGNAPC